MAATPFEECKNLVLNPIYDQRREVRDAREFPTLKSLVPELLPLQQKLVAAMDSATEKEVIETAIKKVKNSVISTVPTMAVTGNVKSGKSSIVQCITGCGEFAAVGVKATTSLPFLFEHTAGASEPFLTDTTIFAKLMEIVDGTLDRLTKAARTTSQSKEEREGLAELKHAAPVFLDVFDTVCPSSGEAEAVIGVVRSKFPNQVRSFVKGQAALELTRWGHAALRLCLMIQPSLSAEVCELLSKPPVVRCEFPILGDRDIEFRLFDLPGAAEVGGEAFEKVVQDFMSQESNCIILARPMVGDFVPKQGGHDARLWQRIQSANRPVFVALTMADSVKLSEREQFVTDQLKWFAEEELLPTVKARDIFCVSSTQCKSVQDFTRVAALVLESETAAKSFHKNEALKSVSPVPLRITIAEKKTPILDVFKVRIQQVEDLWFESGYGPFLRRCIHLTSNESFGKCQIGLADSLQHTIEESVRRIRASDLGDAGRKIELDWRNLEKSFSAWSSQIQSLENTLPSPRYDSESDAIGDAVRRWHSRMDGDYKKDGEGVTWTTSCESTRDRYCRGQISNLLEIHETLTDDPCQKYKSVTAKALEAVKGSQGAPSSSQISRYNAEFRFDVTQTRDNGEGRVFLKIISVGTSNYQRFAVRIFDVYSQSKRILKKEYEYAHGYYRKEAEKIISKCRSVGEKDSKCRLEQHKQDYTIAKEQVQEHFIELLPTLERFKVRVRSVLGTISDEDHATLNTVAKVKELVTNAPLRQKLHVDPTSSLEDDSPAVVLNFACSGLFEAIATVKLLQALDQISQEHCGKPLRELTDHVLGTSTGCIVAWLFAVGMPLERIEEALEELSIRLEASVLTGEDASFFIERELLKVVGDAKMSCQYAFAKPRLVCYDVTSQSQRVFGNGDSERVLDVLMTGFQHGHYCKAQHVPLLRPVDVGNTHPKTLVVSFGSLDDDSKDGFRRVYSEKDLTCFEFPELQAPIEDALQLVEEFVEERIKEGDQLVKVVQDAAGLKGLS